MKYKVTETYTPDDVDSDRSRHNAEFETDSTVPLEVATLAFVAILDQPGWQLKTEEEKLGFAKKRLDEDDVAKQISDLVLGENGDLECFSFLLFSNNGEYHYEIEQG